MSYFGTIANFKLATQLSGVVNMELALNCVTLFTDTSIAAVLMFLLWRSRSGAGCKRTNTLLKRLIAYTIGTGLVTGLWTVVAVIGVSVKPDSFIYLLVDLVITKCKLHNYSPSMLARHFSSANI